jgi:N-carbamoyl-L-amino-acid hydrolase
LLRREDLHNPRGGRQNLLDGLQQAGLTEEGIFSAQRHPKSLAGYLELHIEQGPRLERASVQIGVVQSITGYASFRITFIGRADHAGTTPTQDRRDASLGASAFILEVRRLLSEEFAECAANIGQAIYQPGLFNVVPARVTLDFECRAPQPRLFSELVNTTMIVAKQQALRFGLGLEVNMLARRQPVRLQTGMQRHIQQAAEALGLSSMPLNSYAEHDAEPMSRTVSAGLIFVPSVGGVSHSPDELTEWQDCVNGANVLLHAALQAAIRSPLP